MNAIETTYSLTANCDERVRARTIGGKSIVRTIIVGLDGASAHRKVAEELAASDGCRVVGPALEVPSVKRGFVFMCERLEASREEAFLQLYDWAVCGNRVGNPYCKPEVRAANIALGGNGRDLPPDLEARRLSRSTAVSK